MDALTTPSNWQRVRLGDICYLKNGFSFKSDLFKNMGIPIIRISNISSVDNCINTNDLVFYDPILIDNDYILKQGDLILAMSGATTGKSCLYNLNKIAYLNQRVGVFRAKTSFCYDFLVQFVFSELFTSRLKLILTAGAQPNISSFDIEDFEILLPPLDEQIAIANILSDVDRYLYSLDALILKKESVKKALSFELLSQRKRLKGFNQAWQRVRLGDIGITISGLAGKTKQDFINGNAKYITFLNVLNNVIIDTSILENVKIYPNEKQNSFKKYDLFFNTSSETPKEVGMCAVLLDDIDQVFLNSFCFGFRIFDKAVDSLFLSYLINSEIGRKAFENLAQGSTRYNLSKSGFNNVCLILPPLNEQIAIANILSDLDSEIISLKNKKRQFENIKKALNHDLMSAKIRVLKK